jgi:uncharacterized protein (DUF58 family)
VRPGRRPRAGRDASRAASRAAGSTGALGAEAIREAVLRSARIGVVRSRREARGPLVGEYASAFRSGGMVFEESRPYVPGDDVRRMDWNAMARSGLPWVKHYREERDRAVSVLLDTSASMAFASRGPSLAELGARVAALLVAVAARAGDRVRLLTSEDAAATPFARGTAGAWRIIEALARRAAEPGGRAGFESVIERAGRGAHPDAIVFVVSDFRPAGGAGAPAPTLPAALAGLAKRSDVISVVLDDPLSRALPAAGRVRIADPEAPTRTRVLDTGDSRVRSRYAALARERARALERGLRRHGSDVVWLRTDRDPLPALAHFFRVRAAHVGSPSP